MKSLSMKNGVLEILNILNSFCQEIAGGVIGVFLLTGFTLADHPNGYSFFIFIFLPVILFYGSVIGFVVAGLIW